MTAYVADFIVDTKYADIAAEVMDLARKSILDGIGLALCGSVAKTGEIVRAYLKSMGATAGPATVIGSSLKAPVRFRGICEWRGHSRRRLRRYATRRR